MTMLLLQEDVLFKLLRYSPPSPASRYIFTKKSPIFATKKKVDEGSTAELKCFISCAPLTTTTWEKDGMPLLSNNLISLSEKTGVVVTLSLDLIPDFPNIYIYEQVARKE